MSKYPQIEVELTASSLDIRRLNDDGVTYGPWTRHAYGTIRSVFPIINEDAGTLDSVNQAKQNYHHNDKLRVAIEFSSGIQTKEEFDIQDVLNQPGWTADQDGLDTATGDIMDAVANFNTASGGSEAEIDGSETVFYVRLATTGVLATCVYDNGTAGVGATLTGSANGVLGQASTPGLIDNYTPVAGDLVLIKNQLNQIQNGIYVVTDLGSVSDPFVLTRPDFYDETTELDSSIVFVASGNTNGGRYFIQTFEDPILGTNRIVYKADAYSTNVIPVIMVDTVSIVNIAGTYANGDDFSKPGELATIKATSNGTLGTINGVLMTGGKRIILTNQTNPAHNGIYYVSNPGSVSSPYVLTRLIGDSSLTYLYREYLVNNTDSTYFGKRYTVTSPAGILNQDVGTTAITIEENIVASVDTNFANTNLTFTANRTHDLDGYVLTLDNGNLTIIATADTSAHYPIRLRDAANSSDTFYVRGDKLMFFAGGDFLHQTSEFQATYTAKGSGASRFNLQNNVNNGMSLFANSGQGQITHISGFLQYTLRSGLTAAGNVELDGITWAYEDGGVGVANLVSRFKKANGEVFKVTIAGVYEP